MMKKKKLPKEVKDHLNYLAGFRFGLQERLKDIEMVISQLAVNMREQGYHVDLSDGEEPAKEGR